MLGHSVDAVLHVLLQVCKVFPCERILTSDHVKEDGAKGPDIGFKVIQGAFEHFWSHVQRCTTHSLMELTVSMLTLCQA